MHRSYRIILWPPATAEAVALKNALEPMGYSCVDCNSEWELKDLIVTHHHNIGLIAIDESVGDIPGHCRTIKGNELLHCYVLILASRNSSLTEHEVLDSGVRSGADVFKALADPIRLRLAGLLAERPRTADEFVGVVHSILRSTAPGVTVIDAVENTILGSPITAGDGPLYLALEDEEGRLSDLTLWQGRFRPEQKTLFDRVQLHIAVGQAF